jgi:hypothetical protein
MMLSMKCRAADIQNEVITSHKKNVEIDWRWELLEEKEDCEELAKVISLLHLNISFTKTYTIGY